MLNMLQNILEGIEVWRKDLDTVNKEGLKYKVIFQKWEMYALNKKFNG